MTCPDPPHPLDGFAGAVVAAVAALLLVWVVSPWFNRIMRVLQ